MRKPATAGCPISSFPTFAPFSNRSHFIVDNGQLTTAEEDNLRNITPAGGVSPAGVGPGPLDSGCPDGTFCTGLYLDYASQNEKATSTMFATEGFLSLVTFTPDATNPCATEGNSFRYRFFFLTGASRTGGVTIADYREGLGGGFASPSQSSTKTATNDWVFSVGGGLNIQTTPGTVTTINQNWKEQ